MERHRLAPLFHRELTESPWRDVIPPPVRRSWENSYNAGLARTAIRSNLLRRILVPFREKGIEVILLKGADLAERYYPHPALRPFDDVDALIHPEDGDAVRSVLERSGFGLISETVTARKFAFSDGAGKPMLFLEVHDNLQTPRRRNPSFDIRIEDFWESSRPVELYDSRVRVLKPTLNLIYLAAHLSHHGFSRLIWFHDLHLILENDGETIDWKELAGKSRRYRSAVAVYYALRGTRELFRSPLPGFALAALSPPHYKKWLLNITFTPARILGGEFSFPRPPSLAERFLMNDKWISALKWYILSFGDVSPFSKGG